MQWAYSLLHHAARENRLDVVDTLVSNGSTLDSKDRYQQTPLWWACLWGRREVALRLLALGASLWTKANDVRFSCCSSLISVLMDMNVTLCRAPRLMIIGSLSLENLL